MFVPTIFAGSNLDEERCQRLVRSWAEKELAVPEVKPKFTLKDQLFFLHIPRTGGRTLYACFLHQAFAEDLCPMSYHRLRFDTSQPGCRLISTHDDYSLARKLPPGKTSVLTNLRDPVSRAISAYQYVVSYGSSLIRIPKPRINSRALGSVEIGTKFSIISPYWPWNFLVSFMSNDISARLEAIRAGDSMPIGETPIQNSTSGDEVTLPYMSFEEFIQHPIAHELVHNGQTFQVTGITNSSYIPEAKEIRACVIEYPHLGRRVLDVGKRRLDDMFFGLTERQEDTVALLASLFHGQTLSRGSAKESKESEKIQDAVDGALKMYRKCHKEQPRIETYQEDFRFMIKDRKLIPKSVLDQVKLLNNLDVELYSYAQILFQKNLESHYHRLQGISQGTDVEVSHVSSAKMDEAKNQEHQVHNLQRFWIYIGFCVVLTILSGTALFIFIRIDKKYVTKHTKVN